MSSWEGGLTAASKPLTGCGYTLAFSVGNKVLLSTLLLSNVGISEWRSQVRPILNVTIALCQASCMNPALLAAVATCQTLSGVLTIITISLLKFTVGKFTATIVEWACFILFPTVAFIFGLKDIYLNYSVQKACAGMVPDERLTVDDVCKIVGFMNMTHPCCKGWYIRTTTYTFPHFHWNIFACFILVYVFFFDANVASRVCCNRFLWWQLPALPRELLCLGVARCWSSHHCHALPVCSVLHPALCYWLPLVPPHQAGSDIVHWSKTWCQIQSSSRCAREHPADRSSVISWGQWSGKRNESALQRLHSRNCSRQTHLSLRGWKSTMETCWQLRASVSVSSKVNALVCWG